MTAPQNATAAALRTLAQGIKNSLFLVPTNIDVWHHGVPLETFMAIADGLDAKINMHEKNDLSPGHVSIKSNFPTDGGSRITIYYLCNDLSDKARQDYATHNTECVTA